MSHASFEYDAILDLLIERATSGLTNRQQRELQQQLDHYGLEDDWSIDQTVAVVHEGLLGEQMPQLPGHIKQNILLDAEEFVTAISQTEEDVDESGSGPNQADTANGVPTRRGLLENSRPFMSRPLSGQSDIASGGNLEGRNIDRTARFCPAVRPGDRDDGQPGHRPEQPISNSPKISGHRFGPVRFGPMRAREWVAWLVTAASIAIAAFAFWSLGREPHKSAATLAAPSPLISPSTPRELDEFRSNSADLLTLDLRPGGDETASGASGTVYWNEETKRGFIRLAGLHPNDPQRQQYQLWVIDRIRGFEERPNAGVFNIANRGEAVFEFRSELKVFDAKGFAITVEKPGGVNKSDLSRIALANLGG